MWRYKWCVGLAAVAVMSVPALDAGAQNIVEDEDLRKQLQAMELGEIDFSPKTYYRIMHGEPEVLNAWLGDKYAVYDHKWEWAGFHSGFEWKFNQNKSKAINIAPLREAYELEMRLVRDQYREVRDSLVHRMVFEMNKAAACEFDLNYAVYKDEFQKYDDSVIDLMNGYSYILRNKDRYGILGNIQEELDECRQFVGNIHDAYMENASKEEAYSDIRKKYQKLLRRMSNYYLLALGYKNDYEFHHDPVMAGDEIDPGDRPHRPIDIPDPPEPNPIVLPDSLPEVIPDRPHRPIIP